MDRPPTFFSTSMFNLGHKKRDSTVGISGNNHLNDKYKIYPTTKTKKKPIARKIGFLK
ncbi:hypothetical protein BCI9360_02203 [Bacillus sp. CECT 9360]|nr:hypothetical protein BCI9360_02203 [Bacillus sp. CECT 9360]